MTPELWLAYLALGGGLVSAGAILTWLGLRRPSGPAGRPLRAVLALLFGVAGVGAAAAAVLEARAAQPW